MRKIKKINGYLVVKFNDRERREWEQLGVYGVIDAELYTGHVSIDRGAMEYDDADTLEVAIEQAEGLESELDVDEVEEKITIIHETDEDTVEEEINPQLLIAGWETTLGEQIKSGHHPNVNPMTARHELYGFKVALRELGLLASSECYVLPDAFDNYKFVDKEARDKLGDIGLPTLRDIRDALCGYTQSARGAVLLENAERIVRELNGFVGALEFLKIIPKENAEYWRCAGKQIIDNRGISETAQTGKGPSDKQTAPRGAAHEEAVKHMAECYLKRHPVPKQIEVDNG